MATPNQATVRAELPKYSMFSATPTYQVQAEVDTGDVETVVVFGLKRDVVVPHPSDIQFTVPAAGGGRLDLVSQKFYSTPDLFWAISRCNPALDPMLGPNVAEVISVPTRLRLASLGILSV
jgi:hypothetical protein